MRMLLNLLYSWYTCNSAVKGYFYFSSCHVAHLSLCGLSCQDDPLVILAQGCCQKSLGNFQSPIRTIEALTPLVQTPKNFCLVAEPSPTARCAGTTRTDAHEKFPTISSQFTIAPFIERSPRRMQSMKDVLRHFLLSGDLIENLAEAILYELIAENCCSGALSTVSILIDMDHWSTHLYKAWQRTA